MIRSTPHIGRVEMNTHIGRALADLGIETDETFPQHRSEGGRDLLLYDAECLAKKLVPIRRAALGRLDVDCLGAAGFGGVVVVVETDGGPLIVGGRRREQIRDGIEDKSCDSELANAHRRLWRQVGGQLGGSMHDIRWGRR